MVGLEPGAVLAREPTQSAEARLDPSLLLMLRPIPVDVVAAQSAAQLAPLSAPRHAELEAQDRKSASAVPWVNLDSLASAAGRTAATSGESKAASGFLLVSEI